MSSTYLKQQEKIRAFPEVADGDVVISTWGPQWDCAQANGLVSVAKKTGPTGAVRKFYVVTADLVEDFRSVFAKWEEARKKKEAEHLAEVQRQFAEERRKHEEDEQRRDQPLSEDTEVYENCRICEFSHSRDTETLECRRSSPHLKGFPIVEPHWWCGEWKRMGGATVRDAEDAEMFAQEEIRRLERMGR